MGSCDMAKLDHASSQESELHRPMTDEVPDIKIHNSQFGSFTVFDSNRKAIKIPKLFKRLWNTTINE